MEQETETTNKMLRGEQIAELLIAYCENPANFETSHTMASLSKALKISSNTLSMHLKVLHAQGRIPHIQIGKHGNAMKIDWKQ